MHITEIIDNRTNSNADQIYVATIYSDSSSLWHFKPTSYSGKVQITDIAVAKLIMVLLFILIKIMQVA